MECAEALSKLRNKPEYYGVALLEEAIKLRTNRKITEPILCFAPFDKSCVDIYIKNKIIPTIASKENIKELLNSKISKKIKIHVNINSGMNRLGINYSESVEEIKKLTKSKNIIVDGIYTHFATSDNKDKTFANLQLSRFSNVIQSLKEEDINFGLVHTSNSGAILDLPDSYFDMVRPGISLYGYYPSLETSESIKLKPVMSLYSSISTIFELPKGNSVGYGGIFTSKNNTVSGTLPIGYADGLNRGLSGKINVIVKDKLYPQIGRISMDRININLFNEIKKNKLKVVVLGKTKSHEITAWDWSKILNTIPYEITCNISKRVIRKYVEKIN